MGLPTMAHGSLGVCCTWKKNEVKEFALTTVPIPDDATHLAAWKRSEVKARKILMDFVKNHLVSHLSKSETAKDMFDSLKKLFE